MPCQFPRSVCCLPLLIGLWVAVSLSGCNQKDTRKSSDTNSAQPTGDEHEDHAGGNHQAPESFADGVAELKEHYTEIKEAFAHEESEKAIELAHDPLHGIGHILESLPDLAAKAELSAEDLETVKKSVAVMFDCYMNIDGDVHNKKTPDYKTWSDKLDEAMEAIVAVLDRQKK